MKVRGKIRETESRGIEVKEGLGSKEKKKEQRHWRKVEKEGIGKREFGVREGGRERKGGEDSREKNKVISTL